MKRIITMLIALMLIVLPSLAEPMSNLDYTDDLLPDGSPIYYFPELSLTLPADWNGRVMAMAEEGRTAFYQKVSYEKYQEEGLDGGGFLFALGASVNSSFSQLPAFEYIGFSEESAMNYYLELPTDYPAYMEAWVPIAASNVPDQLAAWAEAGYTKFSWTYMFDNNGGDHDDAQSFTINYMFDNLTLTKGEATDPEIQIVNGEVVDMNKNFTVTFVTGEGMDAPGAQSVRYNHTAEAPAAPTKEGYTFDGWYEANADEAFDFNTPIKADTTLTAKWTVNEYTVKFVDENGTELSSAEYDYGTTAADIVKPADPTKAADAQYTYTFVGWMPEIAAVTGEATYTATYTTETNKYKVTFVNEDGTELQSSEVAYGETPEYTSDEPTKAATDQYTYTFAGWDSEVVAVTGETTYKATYSSTVNKYEITWVNGDTVLDTTTVAYGDTPAYDFNKGIPTKTADGNTYTFSGWKLKGSEEDAVGVQTVTDDATYEAQFTEEYDTDINAPADPTRTGYAFLGWKADDAEAIAELPARMPAKNVTYTAQWANNIWTVDTITANGTVDENVVTFSGATVGFSPANASIGRSVDGYWVGGTFNAPEFITKDNIADVQYSNDGGETWKNFAKNQDGKVDGKWYMGAWLPVSAESIEAFLNANQVMTWTYKFTWNGDRENAQTFTITVDPQNVKLTKDGGTTIQTVDGKIQTTFEIDGIADQPYTGSAVTPAVSVTSTPSGATYEVTYDNNVEAGTAKAIVTGIGAYKGTAEKTFTITAPVAKIGEEVGIRDAFYFSRAFKKQYGMAPRQYRETLRARAE